MAYHLPDPESVKGLSEPEKEELLTHLFERCPTLTSLLIPNVLNKSYPSYTSLIEACRSFLLQFLDQELAKPTVDPRIADIIAAHPRLGAKKVESSHSQAEQASLQKASEEEAQKLKELNDLYERTFPGLRYVVFVNGRSREVIMDNMKQRIARGDINAERREAFNAMCDIALDRAGKLTSKL